MCWMLAGDLQGGISAWLDGHPAAASRRSTRFLRRIQRRLDRDVRDRGTDLQIVPGEVTTLFFAHP